MSWNHVYPGALVHDMHVDRLDYRPSWTVGGKPVLIVGHFTVTCGVEYPGAGRFGSEGIGSAFGIRQEGTVCQYVDLDRSTWHARDCSHYGVGIEFDANPGAGCLIQPEQLEAGARLCAWLCKTFGIPAKRSPGIAYTPGLKCHTDGLEDGGAKWDSALHWDAPWKAQGDSIDRWISRGQAGALNLSPWTSQRFVGRVVEILNPPQPPGGDDLNETEVDARIDNALTTQTIKDARTQAFRQKAIADVVLGLPKRTGQGAIYDDAYDKAKEKLG